MTNTNNEKFVNQLIETVVTAQQKRNNEKHEAVLNAHPWISQAREIQKKLNESESN
jgi:hypothetical protein